MLTIEAHLLLLAMTAAAGVVAVLAGGGRGASLGPRAWLGSVAPVLLMGVVGSLLLMPGRRPLLQWLLPLLGLLAIGARCGSGVVFRSARIAAPALAAALTLHFVWVATSDGATNSPEHCELFSEFRRRAAEDAATKLLLSEVESDAEVPPGPLDGLFDDVDDEVASVVVKHGRPEWHSWFTGLFQLERRRETLWFRGGRIAAAATKWEWKSSPAP